MAVGPDGAVYVTELSGKRVRRIAPDGVITTVAGNGTANFCVLGGDGGMATAAPFCGPLAVTVASDGTLYIADQLAARSVLRQVSPDGTITTIAGQGSDPGDGRASTSYLNTLADLQIGPDGTVVILDSGRCTCGVPAGPRLRRLTADGRIETLAGGSVVPGYSGDGGPAVAARFASPESVAVTPDGEYVIADANNRRIRRVDRSGIVTTIAGQGGTAGLREYRGDAASGTPFDPHRLALHPDGSLIVHTGSALVRMATSNPGYGFGDTLVPSWDGNEVHLFRDGRHLRTSTPGPAPSEPSWPTTAPAA